MKEENRKTVRQKVKKTYGFDYDAHFSQLLAEIIGRVGVERIEGNINLLVLVEFRSELSSLKGMRNLLAHSYTKGATTNYDAPSVTLSRFQKVAAGMKAFDVALRSIQR